jgi:hypothetical protein
MTGETCPPAGREREPAWSDKVVQLNAALAARAVPYAFGGAVALNYHREPRSTLDIDINLFVAPVAEEPVLDALAQLFDFVDRHKVRDDARRDGQARTSWGYTYLDLFFANTDFHASMASRVQHQPFGAATIPVLSIEDLVVCKVLYDRPKDWIDIDAVAATRRGELDRNYISSWLGQFLEPNDPRLARIAGVLGQE